ncbi:MAG TPA: PIG-L family deacetylase, partial [Vicinamibacterales bacterium]
MHLTKRLVTSTAPAAAVLVALFLGSGDRDLQAQNRKDFSTVDEHNGHVALGLAIRKLNTSGTFMQAPAHPDDETNALFAMFTHGWGLRSVDVQNNRGEGGQNEIGPELFRDMGVLRTAELMSAHRLDGAEQYFTRAIDFGYSFDPQEVIGKWGRDTIVGDYVRLIRTLRPDVIVTMNIQGSGGDRAHEATTVLTREAFRAAADPTRYPDQLRQGLRPWQAAKLYFAGGGPAGRGAAGPAAAPTHVTRVDTAVYDPLLGRTYAEIGNDARSNHKCQGVGGVPPLPGGAGGRGGGRGGGGGTYTLADTTIAGQKDKDETSLFDGVDVSLAGLAKYAGTSPPPALVQGLHAIVDQAERAKQAFSSGNDAATAAPIEAGLAAVRALRSSLGSLGLSDTARYEIDFRLKLKEQDYQDAVLAAHDLTFQVVADDGLVIAGQPVRLSLIGVNHGASDVTVSDVAIAGFDNPGACASTTVKPDGVFTCTAAATVPKNAKATDPYFTDTYWKNPSGPAINAFDPSVPFGVPFAPTPFHVTFHVKAGSADVTKDVPVEYRYVKDLYFGDKRMKLNVVPAFSVVVTPTLAVFPAEAASAAGTKPATREIFVSVTNSTKGAAEATVALELPAGWTATPATAAVAFDKEDESRSARFVVVAPAHATIGDYTARAVVTSPSTGAERFTTGYQAIEYPHIERQQVIKPAAATMKVIDVDVAPGLAVGYI